MTDDTAERESNRPPTETEDDPRFEVKWRKKESSSTPRPAAAPTDEDSGSEVAELRRQLDEAQQRVTDLQDRWHRAQADLANLRKRTEQDRGDMEKFASMMLVAELLPVLDNFDRALATIPGNLNQLTWVHGVMLIERHVRAILEHQGLAVIEAEGQPFNPHRHEAIGERVVEGAVPGTIVQVYQRGYTMHGRVIRPALVELAQEPDVEVTSPEPERTTTQDSGEMVEDTDNLNTGP